MRPTDPEDDTIVAPSIDPEKPRGWLRRVLIAALFAAGLGAALLILLFSLAARDLPRIESLADYRPKQATVIYGKDGQVVARFATERRTVVGYERLPPIVIDAVVAAEDSEFFEHQGVDYPGILRCFVKNLISGRKAPAKLHLRFDNAVTGRPRTESFAPRGTMPVPRSGSNRSCAAS